MDHRPIGVFDSGLGGLTAVKELAARLPGEDIVYFGDTARVPYGNRSEQTILRYSRQDIRFLSRFGMKAMLIACNTVSSTVLPILESEVDIPLWEVVRPAARRALAVTRNGKVGVIATAASIASRAYERALDGVQVFSAACPLFVPLVENGRFRPGDVVAETVVAEYLRPVRDAGVDTLILGCTHYPLLSELLSRFMGPGVQLVNSGAEAARALAGDLPKAGLACGKASGGTLQFYVSDNVRGFSALASLFLEREVEDFVKMVDIDTIV